MKYTTLGRTGLQVGILGLGMEHVDVPDIVPTVHRAIDLGANYIDIMIWRTARKDEFGRALAGKRDKVILAGHLGVAETNGQYRKTRDVKEVEGLFHDQLRRLNTDFVDILHVTYVDSEAEYDEVMGPGSIMEMALRYQRQGKARFIAMSGHVPAIAIKMIDSGHIDAVMQAVNLSGPTDAATLEMCQVCAGRNIGLVVMKAFKGGGLLQGDMPLSPITCLSYVLAQPGVSTVALGVKNVGELEADFAYLEASEADKDFAPALAAAPQAPKGACVYCGHCLPCPPVIDIPAVLRLLAGAQYDMTPQVRSAYASLPIKASECIECGLCLDRCPFAVPIIEQMHEAVEVFGV